MTVPQISLAQANRYLLKRQHLLTPSTDPLQATADACGLQAQVPSSPALSLRARVKSFARADYDRMLTHDRTVVRTWAMRGTIHTVRSAQLPMYTRVHAEGARLAKWLGLERLSFTAFLARRIPSST